jgi:hypothetical protein
VPLVGRDARAHRAAFVESAGDRRDFHPAPALAAREWASVIRVPRRDANLPGRALQSSTHIFGGDQIDGAKRYAEGTGVRFEIKDRRDVEAMEALAALKMAR